MLISATQAYPGLPCSTHPLRFDAFQTFAINGRTVRSSFSFPKPMSSLSIPIPIPIPAPIESQHVQGATNELAVHPNTRIVIACADVLQQALTPAWRNWQTR
jgi:hypothetical protein